MKKHGEILADALTKKEMSVYDLADLIVNSNPEDKIGASTLYGYLNLEVIPKKRRIIIEKYLNIKFPEPEHNLEILQEPSEVYGHPLVVKVMELSDEIREKDAEIINLLKQLKNCEVQLAKEGFTRQTG